MARVRRGVSLEQTQDDLERLLNVQETRTDAPEISVLKEAQFTLVDNGTGEVFFRLGGKLWKLTATEVT